MDHLNFPSGEQFFDFRRNHLTFAQNRLRMVSRDQSKGDLMENLTCANCGNPMDLLEVFPGKICLDCHKETPEGKYMPTAEELTEMWGGKS